MNCDKCPHMVNIKDALKPCQTCDAGRLCRTCHVAESKIDYLADRRPVDVHASSACVTNLSPENEDKLRRLLASIFSLNPIRFFMAQEIFNGRSLADFGKDLSCWLKKADKYRDNHMSRATAHAMKNAISREFPEIAHVFDSLIKDNSNKLKQKQIRTHT